MRMPVTTCDIAQPVKTRLKKNAIKGRPMSKTETPKNGIASKAAGIIPINVLIKLIEASAIINSHGLSGATKRFPKFLDHISSRKESV
jgi:hypothetical protein